MFIGNLKINGYAALAPMAGVADRAFREVCKSFGCAYVITEMVSSKGLTMQDKKSKELLFISHEERPAGAQIFGDTPETMAKAAVKALEFNPDFIDINMGCPAPKISGNGSGAALMKDPVLAGEIVNAVRRVVDIPLTVKMRIGWDNESINCVELAKICEANGADAITVHGRTKVQMYSPPVNQNWIKAVKDSVNIPVIGNGDVVDGKSAAKMLDNTGCDFLMIGRGALGAPWVFSQIDAYLKNGEFLPDPSIEEKMNIMINHIKTICLYKGEYVAMREARKHAAWYIKGMRGAAELRREIGSLESINQLEFLAEKAINLCNLV